MFMVQIGKLININNPILHVLADPLVYILGSASCPIPHNEGMIKIE